MRKFLGCLLLPVAFFFLLFAAVTVFAFNSEAVAEGVDPFFAIAAAAVFGLVGSCLLLFAFMLFDSSGRFASWFFRSQAITAEHPVRQSRSKLEPQVGASQGSEVELVTATISGIEMLMSESERNDVGLARMNASQKRALEDWVLRLCSLRNSDSSSCGLRRIERLRFGGRVIELDDGTSWEVDEFDTIHTSLWSEYDEVFVDGSRIFNLSDCDEVTIEQTF